MVKVAVNESTSRCEAKRAPETDGKEKRTETKKQNNSFKQVCLFIHLNTLRLDIISCSSVCLSSHLLSIHPFPTNNFRFL